MTWRRWSAWIVPLLYAAIAVLTFRNYGITLDESPQMHYGDLVLDYFRSGFVNHDALTFSDLRFYGPLFEIIPAMLGRLAPALKYDIHHLCIAVAGLGTIVATGFFAKDVDADPFFAQLALVAQPQFYGHSFNNSKDIPLACALTWGFVALERLANATDREARTWKLVLATGLAIGSALAIRAGSAPLFVMAGVVVVILSRHRGAVISKLGAAAAIAWGVMIAFWPWAHQNAIRNPLVAMATAIKFPRVNPVLFEGVYIQSNALPRRYLVEMLAITTPPR